MTCQVDLKKFVPEIYLYPESYINKGDRQYEVTGEYMRNILDVFNEVLCSIIQGIDKFPELIDPANCTDENIDKLLKNIGFDFRVFGIVLDSIQKRKLYLIAVDIYRQKGTAIGIRNLIRTLSGIEVLDIVSLNNGWVLGESELGIDTIVRFGKVSQAWILGVSELGFNTNMEGVEIPRAIYSFYVTVNKLLSLDEKNLLTAIIIYMKPIHTHFLGFIEPEQDLYDHWELGISELGLNTFLHQLNQNYGAWQLDVSGLNENTMLK